MFTVTTWGLICILQNTPSRFFTIMCSSYRNVKAAMISVLRIKTFKKKNITKTDVKSGF